MFVYTFQEKDGQGDTRALLSKCLNSLEDLSFDLLFPWNDVHTEANRRFMLQEGVLDIVLDIYTIDLHCRGDLLQHLEIYILPLSVEHFGDWLRKATRCGKGRF